MCFYDWGEVGVPLMANSSEVMNPTSERMAFFHFNLLYAKMKHNSGYSSFQTVAKEICV